MRSIKNIACLGAGTIGSSWAAFYASKGFSVRLYDANSDGARLGYNNAIKNLESLNDQGLLDNQGLQAAKDNITLVDNLNDLFVDCDYIQESIIEDYAIKAKVYAEIEVLIDDDAIIGSSTSGLLMSEMQKALKHPQRSIIAHPFNPPHLIPLVELVPGEQTDAQLVDDLKVFFENVGKTPVILKKEAPGHIANRLAAALWREALHLVAEGVASVEDVDKALHAGPGLRWAIMGQHLIYHIGGGEGGYQKFIDGIGSSFSAYWETMPTWSEIPSDVKEAAVKGMNQSLQGKSLDELKAFRDDKLAKILQIMSE